MKIKDYYIKGYYELRKRTLAFARQFINNYSLGILEMIVAKNQFEEEFMSLERFTIYFKEFIERYDKRSAFHLLNEEEKFKEVVESNYYKNLELFKRIVEWVVNG